MTQIFSPQIFTDADYFCVNGYFTFMIESIIISGTYQIDTYQIVFIECVYWQLPLFSLHNFITLLLYFLFQ
ncbi:MAG: hypothetical protein LBU34_06560 [Planctomycetaceae bacterium]|nr:hypothetical protein [Planctomycetaceae bacterium]